MAADIQVAVGIDASLARRGREQFVSDCEAMTAAYAKLLNSMKAPSSQTAGAGLGAMPQTFAAINQSVMTLTTSIDKLIDKMGKIPTAAPKPRSGNDIPKDLKDLDRAVSQQMIMEQQRAAAAEKANAAQQASINRLIATYSPWHAELQKIAADEAHRNALIAQGGANADIYQQSLARLQVRKAAVTAESERMATGTKMSTHEMRNLSYQINDVVSGLAMGQSPFMILTQQGGQFIQIAQDAGIGIGRIALGLTAVAAAGVALIGPAVHLANMKQEAKELDIALKAVGNTAAGIGASLQARAAQTAASGISSRGDVTQAFKLAATSATTRNLDPAQIQQLTKAAEGFAFVTGVTLPEAQTTLIKTLSGGYNEMLKLANLYPMATAAELDQLRVMAQHGDQAGMLAKSIELLNRKFGDFATEGASTSTKAFHQMGVAWDTLMDKMSQSRPYVAALEYISDVSRKITNGLILPQTTLFGKMTGAGKEETGGQSPSFPMPAAPAGTSTTAASINEVVSAQAAKANAIMDAAQKEAAAYRLVGQAREKALISAQYDRQIAEAQGDAFKVAELQAQKMAALTLVGVQAMADFNNEQAINIRQSNELAAAWRSGNIEAIKSAQITAEAIKLSQEKGISEKAARDAIMARNQAGAGAEAAKSLEILKMQVDLARDLAVLEGKGDVAGARVRQISGQSEINRKQNPYLTDAEVAAQEKLAAAQQKTSDIQKAYEIHNQSPIIQKQNAEKELARISEQGILTQEDIARRKMAIDQQYIEGEIARLEATRQWQDGAEAALKRYANDATNYGAMAGRAITNSMHSAENALVDLAMGTKSAGDAFRDFATSIVKDLIRIQVQSSITGPLAGALKGGIGSLFTPKIEDSSSAVGNMFSGLYASGTDSAKPGLAIVGENGPELMQMGGGERIYPANQTRAILNDNVAMGISGGGSNSTIVNVEVFDQRAGNSAPIDIETQMGTFGPIVRIIARDEASKAVQAYSKGGGLTNQMRADYNLRLPAVNRG